MRSNLLPCPAKTRYFALKTRFLHTIGFNSVKALGMVQMH